MVRRKAREKLDPPQAEAKKKMHPAPDKLKPSSSPQQHASSMGRGSRERKKEISRSRGDGAQHEKSPSISRSPHYMKSTSCSDARKERVRVQFSAPKTPKTSIDNDSSPSTSSSVAKSLKTLARKASLRPRRPSMKISAASVLSPRKSVTKATCSSTMKDFKFPNFQHLDPGIKRAELTSMIKVCPFGYCSLHGRRHHHLKRLPSVRRRSLKTQASMKLKRSPSHRKRSFRKGRRSIASGKIKRSHDSKMAPMIEEVSDDFSVDIDATPQENYLEHRCKGHELEREISKILCNLDSIENDDYIEEGTEEFDGTMALIEIPEIYSRISFGDNLDQSSDISLDDLFGDSCFPAYEAKEETLPCLHENQGCWFYECCVMTVMDDRNTNLDYWEHNRSIGGTHMDDEEEARSFGGSESESGESSGSEENHDQIGSSAIVYDKEAAGLFAARKIKSSNSLDELSLSVGILKSDNSSVDGVLVVQKCTSVMNLNERVPESDLIFPSDADVLEKNGYCSEHQEEESTIKVQKVVNLEASTNHGDQIVNLFTDVFIQSDSAEETILGDSLVIQGSSLLRNEEISDLIRGNDQNSDVQESCIQLNQHYEFSDTLKMEAFELVDFHEPNLVLVNSIVAEAADDNDKVISILERISSQSMNFEEADLTTRAERPDNIIHRNSAGGGGNKIENCNSFGRKRYEPDDTNASELGNTSLTITANDAEIGDGKFNGNDINACGNEQSELLTHGKCFDNLNISIVVENEKIGSGKCEENIVSSGRKTFKQDLAQSELSSPNNINLSIVADEKAPGLIEESELGLTTDAEIIEGKDRHNVNAFRSEKSEGEDLQESELDACDECPENINLSIIAEDEFPAHHSEVFDVHQNDIVGDLIQPKVKTENCFSCGTVEHLRISGEIPGSCSIDLIEESKSEYTQISKSDSIYSEESKCAQSLQTSKVYNKQKSRHRSLNRRKNLEMEMLSLINPRAPRLLPLNPDQDSEKVDLRHQAMDEGRKPEDWMIDYALQKLVKKLAPARKKKVALLVEAFEAVVPEPICESTLMSHTSGFGRPLQVCS